ncbi:MAG: oxidoreductase [Rhodospirillaceae bacterium]|nr:oxidoreductase [Rhodospirillaceae bacterium]
MQPALFQKIKMRSLTLPNRIIVAPMCQYSASNGSPTDWHLIHLGQLAQSGAGLLIIEATAVEPRGRITHGCLGLYDRETEENMSRLLKVCRKFGNTPIAIQLGHAGRKASAHPPHRGGNPLSSDEDCWETIGPSTAPFSNEWPQPTSLTPSMMEDVITAHIQATERCERIGFDAIELHGAHGYLISSFLSPIANRRTDQYGGDIYNRMKFPLEVFSAMRTAWPEQKPLGVRFNGTDWDDRGLTTKEALIFATALKERGCDFFDISGGGNSTSRPNVGPAYQAHLAGAVKAATNIPTMAVGMIRDPNLAEKLIREGSCDMVALARGLLYEPRWAWRAAHELGAEVFYPEQYKRADPSLWPEAFPEITSHKITEQSWEVGPAPHIMVPKHRK